MPFKVVSQKAFLAGLKTSMDRFNLTKGTIQRSSNFLLSSRGALTVCDGTGVLATDGSGTSPGQPILEIGLYVDPVGFNVTPLMAAPNGSGMGIYSWSLADPMASFPTGIGQWVWDGATQLWIPLTAVPGVTNGSNAAPGTIGEFVTTGNQYVNGWNTNTNPTQADGNPNGAMVGNALNSTRICTLNLSAGDWDLSGGIDMYTEGPGIPPNTDSYWQVYMGPLRPNFADSDSDVDVAWFLWHLPYDAHPEFSMGVIRINTATPVTVIMQAQVDAAGVAPMGADGIIRARRAR